MVHLELDETERSNLMEVLESHLSDMSYEIADTDNFDFREGLKAKRDVLKKVLEAIKQAHQPG